MPSGWHRRQTSDEEKKKKTWVGGGKKKGRNVPTKDPEAKIGSGKSRKGHVLKCPRGKNQERGRKGVEWTRIPHIEK